MRKLITSIMVMCLILMPVIITSASTAQKASTDIRELIKDETVYANLDSYGKVEGIYVVNRIEMPLDGIYEDVGSYKDVTNLTNAVKPIINDGKVQWQLPAVPEGFYYQGTLENGELPFLINLTYKLNGQEMKAEDMSGKAGKVQIKIDVKSNQNAAEYFRQKFMLQIQVPLSLDTSHSINAPGSSAVIVGRTVTLAYMVMPSKDGDFTIEYDTTSFSLDSMNLTSMYMDISSFVSVDLDTGDIKSQVQKMSEGTGELIAGTQQLKDGLVQLEDGISRLAEGGQQIDEVLPQLGEGAKEYIGGVSELAKSAKELSASLDQLAAQGSSITSGYAQLKSGIEALITQTSGIPMLPAEMKTQLTMLKEQLNTFGTGLNDYVKGTSMIAGGMKSFSSGISQLSSSNKELLDGLTLILNGIGELTSGLTKTAEELKTMPDAVQKLIDGQTELKKGIDESIGIFDDLGLETKDEAATKVVSFVSPDVSPRSVQFIMRTKEIKVQREEKPSIEKTVNNKGFWERMMDLFR